MLAVEYLDIRNSMNMLGMAVQMICNRTSMGCLRIKYVRYISTYTLPGVQLACLPRCLCMVYVRSSICQIAKLFNNEDYYEIVTWVL